MTASTMIGPAASTAAERTQEDGPAKPPTFDVRVAGWLADHSIAALRISLGLVVLAFGR